MMRRFGLSSGPRGPRLGQVVTPVPIPGYQGVPWGSTGTSMPRCDIGPTGDVRCSWTGPQGEPAGGTWATPEHFSELTGLAFPDGGAMPLPGAGPGLPVGGGAFPVEPWPAFGKPPFPGALEFRKAPPGWGFPVGPFEKPPPAWGFIPYQPGGVPAGGAPGAPGRVPAEGAEVEVPAEGAPAAGRLAAVGGMGAGLLAALALGGAFGG